MTEDTRFARMSVAEMTRRHQAIHDVAEAQDLDAIVALSNEDDLAGYVRWLTDEPVASYRTVAVYVPDDGVTVIEHGSAGAHTVHDPASTRYRGVTAIHSVASFQSAHYTAGYEAETLVRLLRQRGLRKVGLVGGANMPHRFFQILTREMKGHTAFFDVTDDMDALLMVKSAEEIDHIEAAAALQDAVFAELLTVIRPGLREIDVTAVARAASLRMGGSSGVIFCGSAPQGGFATFKPPSDQNRIIEEGDYLSILIENSGPSGHFTEVARNVVLGTASQQLRDASAQAKQLQDDIIALMRPGAGCADLFNEHNRQRQALGYPHEDRIFAHGQGYNLVERPLIRSDEPIQLAAGMNLAVHPTLADGETQFVVMCDNFLVTDEGMPRLHKTEQKLFEL